MEVLASKESEKGTGKKEATRLQRARRGPGLGPRRERQEVSSTGWFFQQAVTFFLV